MNDLDMVKDVLLSGKMLTELYNRAAAESANNGVRELFLQLHGQEQHNQEVAFSFLSVRGAYLVDYPSREHLQVYREHWREVAADLPPVQGRPASRPETAGAGAAEGPREH